MSDLPAAAGLALAAARELADGEVCFVGIGGRIIADARNPIAG